MTMKLGSPEKSTIAGRRDAFHVPAILAKSQEDIFPGNDVKFIDSSFTVVKKCNKNERHGVVDPFVENIKPGTTFWVLLNPDNVSDLTHHFQVNLLQNEEEIEEDTSDEDSDEEETDDEDDMWGCCEEEGEGWGCCVDEDEET